MNPLHPSGYSRYLVTGRSGTGKSSLVAKLTNKLSKNFNQIIIVSPNWDVDIALKDDLKSQPSAYKKISKVFKEFGKSQLFEFKKILEEGRSQRIKTLVIVDDPVGNASFSRNINSPKSFFNTYMANAKHYYSSLIFSTQGVGALSRIGRINIDCFIMLPDYSARRDLWEMCQFVPYSRFNELMDQYASTKFHALWVNVQYGGLGVYAYSPDQSVTTINI